MCQHSQLSISISIFNTVLLNSERLLLRHTVEHISQSLKDIELRLSRNLVYLRKSIKSIVGHLNRITEKQIRLGSF